MPNYAARLIPDQVVEIGYRCARYKHVDDGHITGYWTGEMDASGQYTIRVVDVWNSPHDPELVSGDTLHLLPQEITVVKIVEQR